ncbi:threo-3-hydroxy-L-aspartate ammonia-lyase [Acetobacter lambici]|uniref:Threo-3-hydroxy-L-aspartate ammonia-lyase n=1 Tax=Acetobacter lambici TaxID=1332824 RepID=A0ABT1EVT8_9PROT|nr:threo-3-hydroxy-L-aspartate ammonia-lyase [Acetobacter lambici]MCP1241264.1 threo-3-hydroxy-L-aspartate ammonia-lyase [Acetobacter lambici]MCP1257066.1 threo-3-hydroxy-L-aspartate ammonia-lyase [Acetobacter lambici]NHO55559.1 threo-3-hydroxy-L-aspartate ammonia-lyase [Acetobacter lambici]
MTVLPTFSDVVAASARIKGQAHRTPVLRSRYFNALSGVELFFKAENFQRVGAFKFRGATNAILALPEAIRRKGIVAFSSGNHAQAIACAARAAGVPAVIVMPADAPAMKLAATRGYGAEVVTYDRYSQDREEIAARLVVQRGGTLLPSFNHPDIIAGQGTAALELLEETGPLDALFVPVGGGGLVSGCALVAQKVAPDCAVIGVEPEAGDDARQSMEAGRIIKIAAPRTIADGAQTTSVGSITFAIMQQYVRGIVTVDDAALVATMRLLAERMKIIVEPTGCLAPAAALAAASQWQGRRVGVLLSGGNIDLTTFSRLVG